MKGYNYLRFGADLVNAADANTKREQAEAEARQREVERQARIEQSKSATEANNALVQERQARAEKEKQEEERVAALRTQLAGLNPYSQDAMRLAMQTGKPDLVNAVFKLHSEGIERITNGFLEQAKKVNALPVDQRPEAHKKAMKALSAYDPAFEKLAEQPYSEELYGAMIANGERLLKSKPEGDWRKDANGQWRYLPKSGVIEGDEPVVGPMAPQKQQGKSAVAKGGSKGMSAGEKKHNEQVYAARIQVKELTDSKRFNPAIPEHARLKAKALERYIGVKDPEHEKYTKGGSGGSGSGAVDAMRSKFGY